MIQLQQQRLLKFFNKLRRQILYLLQINRVHVIHQLQQLILRISFQRPRR